MWREGREGGEEGMGEERRDEGKEEGRGRGGEGRGGEGRGGEGRGGEGEEEQDTIKKNGFILYRHTRCNFNGRCTMQFQWKGR